jgi:hypothetical protein
MMKLIIYLFCTPFLFSQPGEWVTLPNAPVVSRFNDINFINENQGWAVNGWGQIYYTPDAGDSWELQLNQEYISNARLKYQHELLRHHHTELQ